MPAGGMSTPAWRATGASTCSPFRNRERPETMTTAGCDLLCIGPHTDDAEIALGGTLAVMAAAGRRTWVADLTAGELASNAEPEERWAEAAEAGRALGLTGRLQLALPDGFVSASDRDQVAAVVWLLRRLRPRWVVSVPEPRRHPDHLATPALVARAAFLARLPALAVQAPQVRWWRAEADGELAERWICEVVATTCLPDQTPAVIVDVSAGWEAKLAALACFRSQFRREAGRRPTHINDPDFLASIEDRARAWGRRAGVTHGEALVTDAVPVVADLLDGGWR
ncbi:bacillithiol biosynthesis deacetylase BshB1 [bacterium]|nr:bacillithiol biosynthesis deacetylase BshB1 [bacterium]